MQDVLTNDEMRTIMDEYGNYLTQLSYTYVKNWHAAEDIVQESFIAYFRATDKFKGQSSLKTYLSKIVIFKSTDSLRSFKSRANTLMKFFNASKDEVSNTPNQMLEQAIEQTELYKHVLTLKVHYREVIIFYYYDEMTTVEIARLLELPEGTIKTRLKRAREQLKVKLQSSDWEVFQID